MVPLNTSADSPTVSNDSLRDVVSWWCTGLQLPDSDCTSVRLYSACGGGGGGGGDGGGG